jgi:hypothetical protein
MIARCAQFGVIPITRIMRTRLRINPIVAKQINLRIHNGIAIGNVYIWREIDYSERVVHDERRKNLA